MTYLTAACSSKAVLLLMHTACRFPVCMCLCMTSLHVFSDDWKVQASSITEALLMSPRSISSTTTKASPATAPPLGPATHTSQHSAPSPFPLSPLSPGSSRSAANSAHASAEPSKEEADTRGTQSHDARNAAYGRKATDRLGPELMQSGKPQAIMRQL